MGGHSIPEETIRRRYKVGLNNFFSLYMPIAESWQIYDNSIQNQLQPIASGYNHSHNITISNKEIWHYLQETHHEQ